MRPNSLIVRDLQLQNVDANLYCKKIDYLIH